MPYDTGLRRADSGPPEILFGVGMAYRRTQKKVDDQSMAWLGFKRNVGLHGRGAGGGE